ncbi:Rhodanese-like protein, partial [Fistulina hepatica ATCC 64428]
QDVHLIDVREPDEYKEGHIPTAANLPLSVLPDALGWSEEDFKAKFGFDMPPKDQNVVFYCRSGVRSTHASEAAQKGGWMKIHNYKGSWLDWQNQGATRNT